MRICLLIAATLVAMPAMAQSPVQPVPRPIAGTTLDASGSPARPTQQAPQAEPFPDDPRYVEERARILEAYLAFRVKQIAIARGDTAIAVSHATDAGAAKVQAVDDYWRKYATAETGRADAAEAKTKAVDEFWRKYLGLDVNGAPSAALNNAAPSK